MRALGPLLLVLVVIGAVIKYAMWILAGIAIAVLLFALLSLAFHAARRVDARKEKRAALAARADEQHRLVMACDDRGVYGNYPPHPFQG
jgi:uncharacterized membrane protein